MSLYSKAVKAIFITIGLSIGSCVFAQQVPMGPTLASVEENVPLSDGKGSTISLQVGEKIFGPKGEYVGTLGQGGKLFVQTGVKYTTDSGKSFVVDKPSYVFTVYPVAAFSVAGPVNTGGQNFAGGTDTAWGTILGFAAKSAFSEKAGAWELGGFYYFPNDHARGDLFQVDVRHYWKPWLGVQFAYLNSTTQWNAQSLSGYVILRTESFSPNGSTTPWAAEVGLGIFANYAPNQFNGQGGAVVQPHDSYNFSSFFQASIGLKGNLSLVGTEWYIRNRNTDVNRLSVGLAYRF